MATLLDFMTFCLIIRYELCSLYQAPSQPFTQFHHLKNMAVFKTIKILLLTIFVLLLSVNTKGQYSYLGRTSDLGTGHSVGNVSIIHKRLGTVVISDSNGAFSWDFNTPDQKRKFQIAYNLFFAPTDENVQLKIYTNDGKIILLSPTIQAGGSYLLPYLKAGAYLLQVLSDKESEVLHLFSSGESITLRQGKSIETKSPSNDTLLFVKEGYYNTEIAFPKKDTTVNIKLLSKGENDVDFLLGLPDYNAFNLLHNSPFVTNQGEVESVKFIYNESENLVYYMNSKRYEIHYDFAEQFLGYNKGHYHFNTIQYSDSNERYLYPGSINYYKALGRYVLRFYAGDEMDCSKISEIYDKVLSSSYLKGKLFLNPNNSKWENCTSIPIITSDELYDGQNYQALNLAKGYGYLRKVEIDNLNEIYLSKHDVTVLNGIPNDVSVVAGIITTEFQTPLSHINVLSHNRGTPNMALRNAWDNPKLETLLGQLIYLEVLADSFAVRKASLEEAEAFWAKNEPQTTVVLEKEVNTPGLIDLKKAGYANVNIIGGKAANFAELIKLKSPTIPTPENPFAIPFYYYNQHIQNNQLESFIVQMLSDETFKSNQKIRQEKLEELRDKIKQAPIDQTLVELVRNEIDDFKDFDAYRFRSSTNAEDLEFFSGAGLYDSKSAKKNHETKTIKNAIRKVWSSLWNFRAFEEREYYKIDHLSTAMGILVHRSFPDEDANGVVITKNLYNINPGFIVNAQFKEYSIVFPESGILHDQIILYSYSVDNSRDFTIEYLSHSNIPELAGETVLSDSELYELGEYCMQLQRHFFYNVPNLCNCLFDKFGLDIEFKIDSPNGKRELYIKQVRLF